MRVAGGAATLKVADGVVYMVISVRNVGTGLAVVHRWHVEVTGQPQQTHPPLEDFTTQARDIYVASGDIGFWQERCAIRPQRQFEAVAAAVEAGDPMVLSILYGDWEGGQRVIGQFALRRANDKWLTQRAGTSTSTAPIHASPESPRSRQGPARRQAVQPNARRQVRPAHTPYASDVVTADGAFAARGAGSAQPRLCALDRKDLRRRWPSRLMPCAEMPFRLDQVADPAKAACRSPSQGPMKGASEARLATRPQRNRPMVRQPHRRQGFLQPLSPTLR